MIEIKGKRLQFPQEGSCDALHSLIGRQVFSVEYKEEGYVIIHFDENALVRVSLEYIEGDGLEEYATFISDFFLSEESGFWVL